MITAFTNNGYLIDEFRSEVEQEVKQLWDGLEERRVRAEDKLREDLNAQPNRSWEKDVALVRAFLDRKE